MIIELPETITLNEYIDKERNCKYSGAAIKKQLTGMIAMNCRLLKVGTIEGIRKMTFIWKEKTKRRDPDNITFGTKIILDGMMAAGVIPTDGWKLWKGNPHIVHKFELAGKNGVTVLLK